MSDILLPSLFWITPICSVLGLLIAFYLYLWIKKQPKGNEQMQQIAGWVKEGAIAYLRRQYKTVGLFFASTFVLLAIASYSLKVLNPWVPFAFLSGGFFSALAGYLGMITATSSSSPTAQAATVSLNRALMVAFRGGSVMGLVVVGFGLLDISGWFIFLNWFVNQPDANLKMVEITTTMLTFGFGASSQALFARVGGGIFTKAADMGADLVGKVEAGIPEDDPRNPATIADNVGDNVGDVAGMGADLYESYVGSILGTAVLSIPAGLGVKGVILPMIIAAFGIVASVIGISFVRTKTEDVSQKNLLRTINRGINITTALVFIATILLTFAWMPGEMWILWALLVGLIAGVGIGYLTDFYTNSAFGPTQQIVKQSETGDATVITTGISVGLSSTFPTVIMISAGSFAAFALAGGINDFSHGLYGIGLAAVGMLCTLGIQLATDAFGPIADNAGGNAEMSHQDPHTRRRTDALDALGNSTAARGKGLSIGSAAMTAVVLIAALVEEIRYHYLQAGKQFIDIKLSDGSLVSIKSSLASLKDILISNDGTLLSISSIIGLFIGASLASWFCAKTIHAVGQAANKMIKEVRRQFHEIPGLMEGNATPDYAACVEISTLAAQREMILPAMVIIVTPVIIGWLMGVSAVFGIVIGLLVTGFSKAVYMANSGGAWDNAKKYIESERENLRQDIRDQLQKLKDRELVHYIMDNQYATFLIEKIQMLPHVVEGLRASNGITFYISQMVEYFGEAISQIHDKEIFNRLVTRGFIDDLPMLDTENDDQKNYQNFKNLILRVNKIDTRPIREMSKLYFKLNNKDRQVFLRFMRLSLDDKMMIHKAFKLRQDYYYLLDRYKSLVTGDTVGDPLKDTSGPSLNIAIKLAIMVSILSIGFILQYSLIH
ncbi:MAG: sodium-translocating pyrophosphatase [Calditrichia bacterium]